MTDATLPSRVFLDAGGRAPLLPAAREAFAQAVDEGWADPRRLHSEGRRARLLLDGARAAIADAVGARTEEVDLHGSPTLALHAAVRGVARGRRRAGRDVVVSAVERGAALEAATFAAAQPWGGAAGRRVDVAVDRRGRVDLDAWAAAVAAPGVALAALQHANGEVGTVQPVDAARGLARRAGVPLLVDAGASLGHAPVGDAWDVLAADPGDWGAPGGIGVLVTRAGVRRAPDWPEDEDRWSPGGVFVPAALAAAVALQDALRARADADARRRDLVRRIRERVSAQVPDVEVVGDPEDRLPHVVTFSCLYVDGEALVGELDRLGFAVGSGSACASSALEPSHVLAAMGVLTHGNVRLALPRDVRADDVERFCDVLPGAVARVREMLGVHGL
ncbi:aminotransferase class V-fold PLP-dependent enzyme [Cellulomonas cellasea]|uniref:aminotransferase class V-fold PLP-dependent enzyme n=1 Tax=Cellulomonas cellasea TaxID=43670 RepID=UPI0025A38EB4|nr:aminotransferase class V-fold PLP-dependent enzyme [Cellulomonas cellasea]MDM8086051.1 aminotransferase class V-fold PLP-dependent enzyme [Cellulomonas cellasea]